MQDNLEHDQHQDRVVDAQARGQRARAGSGEAVLEQIGENSAGAQSQQRNRNREKREVIEEHHGEQSSERQLQQQCGKAGQPKPDEQSVFGNLRDEETGAELEWWQT